MLKNKKQLMTETILKYNLIDVNKFDHGTGITANFLEYAAEKYKLKMEKTPENKVVKLYYAEEEIARMSGLRPSSTSDVAYRLCKDKFKLEQHLKNMGINTLDSKHFTQEEFHQALEHVQNSDTKSFAVKPLNMAGGKGIQLDVNKDNFKSAWKKCIEEQINNNVRKPSCIIQPFISGFDVRVSIVEGKYTGALLRLPAHVVGNGRESIEKLIEEKNNARSTIGYFRNKLISIDETMINYLAQRNISLAGIPENKEVVFLTEMSNLTFGGESIDITNIISNDIKKLAINAAASIPGLYSTGIDIMTNDYQNGIGYIIEMNTSANLTMHHLPLKGDKRFPYFTFVRANFIKHKVLNNIRLTINEEVFWSEVQRFLLLKDHYANKYFKLTNM